MKTRVLLLGIAIGTLICVAFGVKTWEIVFFAGLFLWLTVKLLMWAAVRWAVRQHQKISPSENYCRAIEHLLVAQRSGYRLGEIERNDPEFRTARYLLCYAAWDVKTPVDQVAGLIGVAVQDYRDSRGAALLALQEWTRLAQSTNWIERNTWRAGRR